jgi:hypothetical protein
VGLKKFTKIKEKTHKKLSARIVSVLNEIQTGHFLNISHSVSTRSNLFNAKLRTYWYWHTLHIDTNSIPLRASEKEDKETATTGAQTRKCLWEFLSIISITLICMNKLISNICSELSAVAKLVPYNTQANFLQF